MHGILQMSHASEFILPRLQMSLDLALGKVSSFQAKCKLPQGFNKCVTLCVCILS